MKYLGFLLVAAVVFAVCFFLDRGFTKLFRSKAQHRSGLAVRAGKKYGIFGIVFALIGVIAIVRWNTQGGILLVGGIFSLLIGAFLCGYYLSFGIFYDEESFLVSSFGKKNVEYRFGDIEKQQLYAVSGGNIIVELWMRDGKTVSVQSGMDGAYPFLDAAFIGWCRQTGHDPEKCDFHDPSKSWWFPHEEEQ